MWAMAWLIIGFSMGIANISEDKKRLNCDEFYVAEVLFPSTPFACLLSKRIYP